ncbi:hypothetical protein A3K87_04530 [Variovorax paradoxus]|uniref:Uncharacterized protein n=1 Tax=Variovorax paradoxus TaxID=34073 RepID=A0AA91I899_VARPD|nr:MULTISPECIES: hypothetical protein [Variovorax]OAK55095.1 hypothetical protein A3K87_04530 [Variovorax paradoxus]QRY30533.1 hypothetical protein JVX96_20915 [Variovorax sp. PDNC026]
MNQAEFHFPMPAQALAPQQLTAPRLPADDEPLDFSDAAAAGQCAYTVRFLDYPHPTADIVKVAEQRFRRELERHLGDDVLRAQRAYVSVSEASEADLTKEEVILATRWVKAYDAARTAGYRDLGDTDEAYFDVRAI